MSRAKKKGRKTVLLEAVVVSLALSTDFRIVFDSGGAILFPTIFNLSGPFYGINENCG